MGGVIHYCKENLCREGSDAGNESTTYRLAFISIKLETTGLVWIHGNGFCGMFAMETRGLFAMETRGLFAMETRGQCKCVQPLPLSRKV